MRKLVLLLFLSATTIPAFTQKGTTLLYGNVGYYYVENSIYGAGYVNTVVINPGIGYGFSKQWTAGLNLEFGYVKQNSIESFNYGAGPFVRYTHPLSEIFSVFGQFETLYAIEKYYGDYDRKHLRARLFPAVELNLKRGFALNLALGGINFSRTTEDGRPGITNAFGVQFGSGMNFGLTKRFGRK